MDIDEWMVMYGLIVDEFGFDPASDLEAAETLQSLLGHRCSWSRLEGIIRGKRAVIAGAALETPPPEDGVLIAADGATTPLLEMGRVPDVIVTDLDGIVEDQVSCCSRGTIVVLHAHGDNVPVLRRWVPRFEGHTCGTTQVRPIGDLRNFGGFTDGDRAVMIADGMGASTVTLSGFRFDRLGRYSHHRDPAVKMAKLRWARRIISTAKAPVEFTDHEVRPDP